MNLSQTPRSNPRSCLISKPRSESNGSYIQNGSVQKSYTGGDARDSKFTSVSQLLCFSLSLSRSNFRTKFYTIDVQWFSEQSVSPISQGTYGLSPALPLICNLALGRPLSLSFLISPFSIRTGIAFHTIDVCTQILFHFYIFPTNRAQIMHPALQYNPDPQRKIHSSPILSVTV